LAIGALLLVHHLRGITTDIGEQRQLTLEDGSRIFLNTATRVLVRYDKQARRIELKRGEAQFDVARNPQWPFIVRAGDREIRALGPPFVVRYNEHGTAVTLVEGKVSVTPIASSLRHTPDLPTTATSSTRAIALTAGQRVTIARAGTPQLDRPPLERV